jgi:hypothetical protein
MAATVVGTALDDRVGETDALDPAVDFYERPNDTPQLFCSWPDTQSVAEVSDASLVLQDCAAGKTYTVPRGRTIGVDLTTYGFDGFDIHDLRVSDSSILETIVPRTLSITGDYIAVYRGIRSGRASISALWRYCFNGNCNDSLRWEATVQVE